MSDFNNETDLLESSKKSKEFENPDSEFSKVDVLFSTDDLYDRQKDYLGGDYDLYASVLSEVEYNYESEFSSLPDIDEEDMADWSSNYYDMNKGYVDIYSDDFLSGDKFAYLYNGVSIVGLHGTHCVVFKDSISDTNGYDLNLIAVDYTNSEFSTEVGDQFDFGQSKTLLICPKYCKLVEYENSRVLYVKMF